VNVAATAGANAAITASLARSKVVQHLQKAGALNPETAVTVPAKASRHTVEALIKHKVLVPAGEGLFYLDTEANGRWNRTRGKAAIAVIAGMLLVLGIVIIGVALFG
jgi:hypothetical protein